VYLARESVESGVDAVDLALTVISTLAASQGMSVVELASKLDATAEHLAEILERLVERRFVFRDPTDLFWLGPQLHYVGGYISERTALVHASTETLEWIVAETHDSASVVMREQLEAVLAMSRGSPEILGLHPMAASRGPLQRSPDINDTEAQYLTSRDLARNQGALAWELRITTSLAHLWRGQGRHDAAREALAAICSRFPETAETADLGAARSLLDDIVSLQP
jgi:hypothetical protein